MDLVHSQVLAEDRGALRQLSSQRADAVVLDLVALDVDAPVRGVRVAPLGPDDRLPGPELSGAEPRGEELLGATVRPGCVDVADAGGPCGVEDAVAVAPHRLDIVSGEVGVVVEGDVPGTSQRGQAEADRGHREAGAPKRVDG